MSRTTSPRRLLIIFNPAAGWRRRRRLAPVLERLRGHGCALTLRETAGSGDAERWAAEVDPGTFDLVVAAGGDGTVNEIVNG
ncbi:MAG: acylglycerol kinase family protein, partial [Geminicoccaceae bacterium]